MLSKLSREYDRLPRLRISLLFGVHSRSVPFINTLMLLPLIGLPLIYVNVKYSVVIVNATSVSVWVKVVSPRFLDTTNEVARSSKKLFLLYSILINLGLKT